MTAGTIVLEDEVLYMGKWFWVCVSSCYPCLVEVIEGNGYALWSHTGSELELCTCYVQLAITIIIVMSHY